MSLEQAWWISWYHQVSDGEFELHNPWWISGYSSDDEPILVAAIRAENEEVAWEIIRNSYDNPPTEIVERFCEELDRSPFSSRFPKADWMVWDEEEAV